MSSILKRLNVFIHFCFSMGIVFLMELFLDFIASVEVSYLLCANRHIKEERLSRIFQATRSENIYNISIQYCSTRTSHCDKTINPNVVWSTDMGLSTTTSSIVAEYSFMNRVIFTILNTIYQIIFSSI